MASTTLPPPFNGRDQILVPNDKSVGAAVSTLNFRLPPPSSHHSPSLSSSPSHSSNSSFGLLSFHDCHSPTSSTPATPLQFQGVPFSWEQIPGIPKQYLQPPKKSNINNNHHSSSLSLLPLPPAGTPCSAGPFKNRPVLLAGNSPKKLSSESFRNDPFFAALVACSKDDHHGDKSSNIWKSSKVTRSISDRFGFISFYASCKTTCAVSESIGYFPRSRNYDHLLNRRSGR